MKAALPLCVLALSLTACQTLKEVNSGLEQINGALSGQPSTKTSAPATGSSKLVKSSQDIPATFVRTKDSKLNTKIKQAEASIADLISATACDTASPKGALNRYWEDPNTRYGYVSPTIGMNYHKSGCVNVIRINGWNMPAKNALQFNVAYESPTSGEGTSRRFTALEQEDGSWLFKPM
jgi:hypothetical protein